MKKKILSLLLALVMVIGLIPTTVFAATTDTIPRMTNMVFTGFDTGTKYFGQAAGTLFQLDENGERTDKAVVSEDCFHYAAYVGNNTTQIQLPTIPSPQFLAMFACVPANVVQIKLSVGDRVIAQGANNMGGFFPLLGATIELTDTETVLTIDLTNTGTQETNTETVTFIKVAEKSEGEKLADDLESLDDSKLQWPTHCDMVKKLNARYNALTEAEKAKVSPELKKKLDSAVAFLADDRKPDSLTVVTPPKKLTYIGGSKFDYTGTVLLATYADGSTRTLSQTKYYTYSPTGELTNETQITFTYNDVSTTQAITVIPFSLEGQGLKNDPYLLTSAEDLVMLRNCVAAGESMSGKYFSVTKDITLPDDWTPIGDLKEGVTWTSTLTATSYNAFSGIIDGNNHTITVPAGRKTLLGAVAGGKLSNLNIYGTKIDGYGVVEYYYVDRGNAVKVEIDNVTLKSGTHTKYSGFIGGYASGVDMVTIRNSTVEAGVVIGDDGTYSDWAEDVKAAFNYPYGLEGLQMNDTIGSFGGCFNGTIENCVSHAKVYGRNYVGGIMGFKGQSMGDCSVTNSTFDGEVHATGNYAGGIVGGGYSSTSATNGTRTSVINCKVNGSVEGKECVGGIVGGEGFVTQTWANATNTVSGNAFTGKVSGSKYVGAIIGYYNSLNKYDTVSGNTYSDDCGVTEGIGGIKYVDTNCATHETASGTTYFDTSAALPGIGGVTKKAHNRTDDPLGADKNKLCIMVESDKYVTALTLTGDFKTKYTVGDTIDTTGMVFTATWNNGTTTTVSANDVAFIGFDSSKAGAQTVTAKYAGAETSFVVQVRAQGVTDITVTFSLLGDTCHGEGGERHTLSAGNLKIWIDRAQITVGSNATVLDVITLALGNDYIVRNEKGNYIQGITPVGQTEELAEFTNGKLSGWMYTLNGAHPPLGVAQQYVEDGDVIVFHYTDDYPQEDGTMGEAKSPAEVIAMINAIGAVDLTKGTAIGKARAAYDKLTDAEKNLVTNYKTLTDAEAAYAQLAAEQGKKLGGIYKSTGDYLSKLGTPGVGSVGGEWMALGLARSGYTVPAGYYDAVVEYVKEHADANERLDRSKSTDNSRIILALTALGKDVTNVGGHNLLKGLDNMKFLQKQGINGPIWALIALDSHDYPTSGDVTREKLVQTILDAALANGGWALSGDAADTDMTAMAIQSLAPYYKTNETVKAAVDKALDVLSGLQQADGGFGSWGTINSESCAQVVVALAALGIDPATDSRFVKNGLSPLDALCSFSVEGGGFKHTANGELNGMATEQGYYALAAYQRFANGQTRLYDMSDVTIQKGANTPTTGDTGVTLWIVTMPVAALAAALVIGKKKREA